MLELAPTPVEIAEMSQIQINLEINTASRDQIKSGNRVTKLAENSIGIQDPICSFELRLLVKLLQLVMEHIKIVENRIEIYCNDYFALQLDLLMDLPGVSIRSAAGIVGFLGNLSGLTENVRQLTKDRI